MPHKVPWAPRNIQPSAIEASVTESSEAGVRAVQAPTGAVGPQGNLVVRFDGIVKNGGNNAFNGGVLRILVYSSGVLLGSNDIVNIQVPAKSQQTVTIAFTVLASDPAGTVTAIIRLLDSLGAQVGPDLSSSPLGTIQPVSSGTLSGNFSSTPI